MSGRPLFVAFGIPVRFDPFFIIGAFLFYTWAGGGKPGIYTVIAMVAFVLVHEFGHALTAKAFGSRPEITVTFLGGFASYVPGAHHTTRHRIAVSLAGPLTQLVVSIPVLWLVVDRWNAAVASGDVVQLDTLRSLLYAVVWAGPFLAFLNLLPFWPLDGGHIVDQLLVRLVGPKAVKPYLIFSLGAAAVMVLTTVAVSAGIIDQPFDSLGSIGGLLTSSLVGLERLTVWSLIGEELRTLPATVFGGTLFIPLFVALGAWGRWQQLQRVGWGPQVDAPSRRELNHADALRAARNAERTGWSSGQIGEYPRGWSPSPWLRAHVEMLAGHTDRAVAALAHLADDDGSTRRWLLDRADRPAIAHLLQLVPPSARDSLAVLEARVHHGSAEDLVAHATARFRLERSAEPLYLGAAGLAVRGMDDEAMAWLARAVQVSPDPHRMGTERELHTLHRRSDFQQLLGEAERAVGVRR